MFSKKLSFIKKFVICLTLAFSIMLPAFYGFNVNSFNVVEAVTQKNDVSSNLSNATFSSVSDSATPATPSSWTKSSTVNTDASIVSGVIDLFSSKFEENKEKYHLTTTPTLITDNIPASGDASYKNLMINVYENSGKLYYTSSSLSLNKNSFYKITIPVYTISNADGSDPLASIYLDGFSDDDNIENKFVEVTAKDTWTYYSFLIETLDSESINIQLWLGSQNNVSKGAVLFNKVQVLKYSEDEFVSAVKKEQNLRTDYTYESTTNLINFNYDYITDQVNNPSFENALSLTDWKIISNDGVSFRNQTIERVNSFTYSFDDNNAIGNNNSSYENKFALFMKNDEDLYGAVESNTINIPKLAYVKISIWGYSNCNTGNGATIKLVEKNNEDNPIDDATITASTSSNADEYTNGWVKYSFYVYGDAISSKTVALQLWLGTTDSATSGYVYFDDVQIQYVPYSDFSNNGSSTYNTTLNFNTDTKPFSFTNSFFNITENENNATDYPLSASGWTLSTDEDYTSNGIVSTVEHNSNLSNYGFEGVRPYALPKLYSSEVSNNVLMMCQGVENVETTYSSTSVSLSTGSYYELSFYVLTDFRTTYENGDGLYIKFAEDDNVIYQIVNVNTMGSWQKYTAYIKTGSSSSISPVLSFTMSNVQGFVYIDNVLLQSSSEAVYTYYTNTITKNGVNSKIDLSVTDFENVTVNSNSALYDVNNWTETNNSTANSSSYIVDTTNSNFTNTVYGTNPGSVDGKNVLFVQSNLPTYYYVENNETTTLSTGTYYKISVWVKTFNVNNYLVDNEDNKTIDAGAYFGLKNIDEKFVSINTQNGTNSNEYQQYIFYINPAESITTSIRLGLGTDTGLTSGYAFFDKVNIETIDEEAFNTALLENNANTIVINDATQVEEESDSSTSSSDYENTFNWFAIPSILTALTILIAVFGFFIRKANFTKKIKTKTSYDRRKTLDKDHDKRERIAYRQQLINDLNTELNNIDNEVNEYKTSAEEKLVELEQTIKEQTAVNFEKIEKLTQAKENAVSSHNEVLEENKTNKTEKAFVKIIEKYEIDIKFEEERIKQKQLAILDHKQKVQERLDKYIERQNYIKQEIAKIEKEIEEIAKEDEKVWADYRKAKADAKVRKTEYKAQVKEAKQSAKADKNKK